MPESLSLFFVALGIPILLQRLSEQPVPFAGTFLAAQQIGDKQTDSTLHLQL